MIKLFNIFLMAVIFLTLIVPILFLLILSSLALGQAKYLDIAGAIVDGYLK